jgi:hypothetical protein
MHLRLPKPAMPTPVCCKKIAEAEAAVSVNEKKLLVMHMHVQLNLLSVFALPVFVPASVFIRHSPRTFPPTLLVPPPPSAPGHGEVQEMAKAANTFMRSPAAGCPYDLTGACMLQYHMVLEESQPCL